MCRILIVTILGGATAPPERVIACRWADSVGAMLMLFVVCICRPLLPPDRTSPQRRFQVRVVAGAGLKPGSRPPRPPAGHPARARAHRNSPPALARGRTARRRTRSCAPGRRGGAAGAPRGRAEAPPKGDRRKEGSPRAIARERERTRRSRWGEWRRAGRDGWVVAGGEGLGDGPADQLAAVRSCGGSLARVSDRRAGGRSTTSDGSRAAGVGRRADGGRPAM